ncbi:hypothetical protein [Erythrobacter sp. WG]|uniref:hypothetical protein n=1 Tax=Erythrobacter sp. WG TaxID=2985510 RepID=UPI003B634142
MEDAGWIERQSDPAGRRARILHLTDKSRGNRHPPARQHRGNDGKDALRPQHP